MFISDSANTMRTLSLMLALSRLSPDLLLYSSSIIPTTGSSHSIFELTFCCPPPRPDLRLDPFSVVGQSALQGNDEEQT